MDAPEPPEGTCVEDAGGHIWYRSYDDEGGGWFRYIEELGDFGGEPESWNKVNSNYGPATVSGHFGRL